MSQAIRVTLIGALWLMARPQGLKTVAGRHRYEDGAGPCARPRMVLASIIPFHKRGGSKVTKAELVDQVADRADLTKQDAGRAVDAVLATVEDALRRGSEVTVAGFGKFHVSDRGARMGVNPRTGERIQIAASRVPRFTAGSGLKSAVKGR
jgi:DNA-binding protein HU-beta